MNWTRDQLLMALNLYFQTAFGKQHQRYPPIIALAEKIGRTPGAVAMKLNNFTSLDPAEKERGISGLTSASNLDRKIWEEFESNRNELAAESESLLEGYFGNEAAEIDLEKPTLSGPTEKLTVQKSRLQQRYFRRTVLASYETQCCLTGLSVPTLLRASHIVTWADCEEQRLNPRNGLCLSAIYDAAFDRGLISFDSTFCLLVGERLESFLNNDEANRLFSQRKGDKIKLPVKNLPSEDFMQIHRKQWGFE